MASEVKVDYVMLDECISELQQIITTSGIDEIQRLILDLNYVFNNTNSDVANILIAKRDLYTQINGLLISLGNNAIAMLRTAKKIYEDTDMRLTEQVADNNIEN